MPSNALLIVLVVAFILTPILLGEGDALGKDEDKNPDPPEDD